MTVTATPIFPQTLKNGIIQILPATTSGLVTAYTAGTNGSKIESILVTNTDTAAAYIITISILISAVAYTIGTVNIPLSTGNTSALPPINLLSNANFGALLNTDANGNKYIYLASGSAIQVNSSTTVNTSKAVTFFTQAEDF